MKIQTKNFWIGVASKDHVENGVKLGICQFCHGKEAPAKRPKKGDFIIYYSPKHTMTKQEPYQQFTAIGIITDNRPYQVTINNTFKPFRRNVQYLKKKHINIKPLIEKLPFISNKKSWGYCFRYGFFKIDLKSFTVIAKAMLGYNPISQTYFQKSKSSD